MARPPVELKAAPTCIEPSAGVAAALPQCVGGVRAIERCSGRIVRRNRIGGRTGFEWGQWWDEVTSDSVDSLTGRRVEMPSVECFAVWVCLYVWWTHWDTIDVNDVNGADDLFLFSSSSSSFLFFFFFFFFFFFSYFFFYFSFCFSFFSTRSAERPASVYCSNHIPSFSLFNCIDWWRLLD